VPGLAATTRRTLRRVPRRRKRRLVVGVSGVDGSGKTTLTRELLDALTIAGVPAGRVWARPGLGLDGLNRLVGMVKRLLGQDAGFAVKQVAAASSPSQARPPSRRGLIGRIWTLIVTLAFLRDSRRQHRRARGVVVHERQQLDALVTLDLAYDPNFALPHVLVRWLEPRSQYAFFLDLAPEVAVRRKPDDIFGEAAVRRQVALYESYLAEDIEVHVLDGKRPVAENVIEVLQVLTGGLPLPHLDGVDPHSP
jgi:hypothetical protein